MHALEDISKGEGYLFRVDERVVFREIDDRMVLINLESGFYYSFNEVGCFIFNRILKNRGIDAILDEIQVNYKVPQAEARGDLEEFMGTLEKEKIIRAVG